MVILCYIIRDRVSGQYCPAHSTKEAHVPTITIEELHPWLSILGGIVGCLVSSTFAVQIWRSKLQLNFVTWLTVLVLDLSALFLMLYKVMGEHFDLHALTWANFPYLQAGWTIAAMIILAAIVHVGFTVAWSRIEKVSVFAAVAAAVLRFYLPDEPAMIVLIIGMLMSIWPQARDYWHKPDPRTLWVWYMSIAATLLQAGSITELSWKEILLPLTYFGVNAGMVAIILRKRF